MVKICRKIGEDYVTVSKRQCDYCCDDVCIIKSLMDRVEALEHEIFKLKRGDKD